MDSPPPVTTYLGCFFAMEATVRSAYLQPKEVLLQTVGIVLHSPCHNRMDRGGSGLCCGSPTSKTVRVWPANVSTARSPNPLGWGSPGLVNSGKAAIASRGACVCGISVSASGSSSSRGGAARTSTWAGAAPVSVGFTSYPEGVVGFFEEGCHCLLSSWCLCNTYKAHVSDEATDSGCHELLRSLFMDHRRNVSIARACS